MNNLKFLRSADILGIDPFFLIKTHKSLHTSLGGCVSIFLFLVMILVSIFFSHVMRKVEHLFLCLAVCLHYYILSIFMG